MSRATKILQFAAALTISAVAEGKPVGSVDLTVRALVNGASGIQIVPAALERLPKASAWRAIARRAGRREMQVFVVCDVNGSSIAGCRVSEAQPDDTTIVTDAIRIVSDSRLGREFARSYGGRIVELQYVVSVSDPSAPSPHPCIAALCRPIPASPVAP